MPNATPMPAADVLRDATETTFTIKRPGAEDVPALLHTVDPPPEWEADDARMNLYFDVPARPDLDEAIYRVTHPRLDDFRARLMRVQAGGQEPDRTGYRAVVSGSSQ